MDRRPAGARAVELLGTDALLTDAATVAVALTRAMPDGLAALRASRSARALVRLGLEADVTYAALEDRSRTAPQPLAGRRRPSIRS